MFDMTSYIMGHVKGVKAGEKEAILDSDNLTFTDDGEGNITITEV